MRSTSEVSTLRGSASRVALAAGPATIGGFYDTIAEGFTTINPAINPSAFAVNSGEATPIKSIADALAAISANKGRRRRDDGFSRPATGK